METSTNSPPGASKVDNGYAEKLRLRVAELLDVSDKQSTRYMYAIVKYADGIDFSVLSQCRWSKIIWLILRRRILLSARRVMGHAT
jgi:hypothetical protein